MRKKTYHQKKNIRRYPSLNLLLSLLSRYYLNILKHSASAALTNGEATSSKKMPDAITVVTNRKSKRPSKIELSAILRKIRHLLAEGYTNNEIMEALQLEERTFYRYMARIYEQDKAYFEKQDNESIATEIRLAKERMLKSLRRYDVIASNESLNAPESR